MDLQQNLDAPTIPSRRNAEPDAAFIMKCTRRCNLRCSYCRDRRQTQRATIDIELVATLCDSVARDSELQGISFIWHGGEPMLLGLPFFRKIVFLQKRLLPRDLHLQNLLQTNACLINDEWASHFAEYRFDVGVSLDGPKNLHDRYRPTANGMSSFGKCTSGIDRLRKLGLKFGILTVIAEGQLDLGAKALMEFFEREKIANYAFLALRKEWTTQSEAVNYNQSFSKFMNDAARKWFADDDSGIHIRELDSKLDRFFGLPSRVCKDRGQCVGRYFGIEADGGIWHCDKFAHDMRFYLGNIFENSFSDIRHSRRMTELIEYERSIRDRCKSCKWFHLCGGGCLHDSIYLANMGGEMGTSDCASYVLFEEISHLLGSSPELQHVASEGIVGVEANNP